MNFETTKWMRNVMTGAAYSIERISSSNLKPKDQKELVNMLGEMSVSLEKESNYSPAVAGILHDISSMQEILSAPASPEAAQPLTELSGRIRSGLDELDKMNYITAALQLDAMSILPLQEQIAQKKEELRQMFQHAVDLDVQNHGSISEITQQAIEAYHFKADNNRVVVMTETSIPGTVREPDTNAKNVSPVQSDSAEKPKYKKLFLSLPKLSPEETRKLEQQLFSDGARYTKWKLEANESRDGKEHSGKRWYIWKAPGMDLKPFEEYLSAERQSSQNKSTDYVKPNPPRYKMNNGKMERTWHGKLPEEMTEKEQLLFIVETDIELNGAMTPSVQKLLKESGYDFIDGDLKDKGAVIQTNLQDGPQRVTGENKQSLSIPSGGREKKDSVITKINQKRTEAHSTERPDVVRTLDKTTPER